MDYKIEEAPKLPLARNTGAGTLHRSSVDERGSIQRSANLRQGEGARDHVYRLNITGSDLGIKST